MNLVFAQRSIGKLASVYQSSHLDVTCIRTTDTGGSMGIPRYT